MANSPSRWRFDRCAGHLALDFANTVSSRHTDHPIERLPSYAELASFAHQSDLVSAARLQRLEAAGARHPAEATAVLAGAVALRDALYRIFAAVAAAREPDARDLEVLNRAAGRLRLASDFTWRWDGGADGLDAFMGPIVRAAIDLLTSTDRRRQVRECEADDCLWLFLDTSKNHSRRWCDMAQCGNRMKARRFVARQKRGRRSRPARRGDDA
jgi:predicted RNA-binding Zn ribbon-like protein